jgi:predicted outer membrane protein
MNLKRLAAFALAALLVPFLPPAAERAFAAGKPQDKQADNQDALRTAMVLSFLHQANLRELDMASAVKTRSDSQAVTSFADRLIADHKAMDKQILDFADRRGINMDAAAEQTRRDVEAAWEDRRVKGVGSATGEWAFTAEPNIDPDIAHLAMTRFKTSLDKLHNLTGSALAREFVQAVTTDHQLVLDRVASARKRIKDPEVAALIDKLLPAYREHLTTAQRLQDRLAKQ